jgi:biopolymer transport protein ExbD/biopolymer transport protein TolR
MLTAHVMDFGLQVEVPKVRPVKENVQDLPVVSISKDGASYLNDKPVNINLLASEIHKRFRNASSVYLRADRRTPFDPIAQVIATLGQAKLAVSVVTQPEDLSDKRRHPGSARIAGRPLRPIRAAARSHRGGADCFDPHV